MVSSIDPSQRYIVFLYKGRYTEQEERIIFQREPLDWFLPIWTLPSVCEIRDKMHVVYKELTHDWVAKSQFCSCYAVRIRDRMQVVCKESACDGAVPNAEKWNLISRIQSKHVKNCLMFMKCNDWVCFDRTLDVVFMFRNAI